MSNTPTNATAPVTTSDEDAINVESIEKAASGGDRPKYLPFKDGTNTYRILPPFGPTAKAKGWPFAEIFLHWWKREGDKSGFPLLCTKKSDVEGCPICKEVERLSAELESQVKPYTIKVGDKTKVDWDKAPAVLKAKAKRVKDIGWQRHYYYNAVSQGGEVGILKIAKSLGDKLNAKISECVKKRSFNPVSRKEGVFFLLTRVKSNTGAYDFEVDYKKATVTLPDGDTAERIIKSPLSEEVLARLDSEMKDLYTLFRPQTAKSLRETMTRDPLDFNPADFVNPDSDSEKSTTDEDETPSEPTSEDVDALAAELGVTKK